MTYYLKNSVWFFAMGLLSTGCISLNGKSTTVARSSEQLYEEYEPISLAGSWVGDCYELTDEALNELSASGLRFPPGTHIVSLVTLSESVQSDLPYWFINAYYKNAQDCVDRNRFPVAQVLSSGTVSTQSFDFEQGAWRATVQPSGIVKLILSEEYYDYTNTAGVSYCGVSGPRGPRGTSLQLPVGKVCDPVNEFVYEPYPDLIGVHEDRLYFGLRESGSKKPPTKLDLEFPHSR